MGSKLTLRGFEQVHQTDVFRAVLVDESGRYSGGYRTRNVLFVDSSGEARWLLPDDDHTVEEHPVSPAAASRFDEQPPPVAIVALVMPVAGETRLGTLYLYDPPGRRIHPVAEQVRDVHGAALRSGSIAVLYERPAGYVLAHFDSATLDKMREASVAVPTLK